jgi:hypothetical protein
MNASPGGRFHRGARDRRHLGGIFASVLIILVGVAMLSDNLGIIHGRDLWDFAPVLLIAIGLIKIFEAKGRPGPSILGFLLAGGGTMWLLENLGLIDFNPRLMFPLIVIGIGVAALLRTLERQRVLAPVPPRVEDDAMPNLVAIFGGTSRTLKTAEFRGGDALAIFGGVELDLRSSKLASAEAVFEANAIFGGIDMKVPDTWIVSVRGMGIFGGYEDKTSPPADPNAPVLVISGNAIFGGVSISN